MLAIRRAQRQILARDLFDRWILEHVARFFPDGCEELGPAVVRATVTEAARAARELGFAADAEVARFVDLTFLLGAGFHRDGSHPWARAILDDPSISDPRERMTRLLVAADERPPAGST
jgi:hypothetical protein